jgi:hypothetical protein
MERESAKISPVVMKRHTRRRPGLTASLGTLLLALVVFSGALDRLPARGYRGSRLVFDPVGDVLYAPAGVPCSQSPHIELARIAKRSWSPVGLHRTRTKSADLCCMVSLARPEMRSFLPPPPDLAAAGPAHRPSGARAPPLA